MHKGKDFYGTEIAEVIEQACRELGLPREQLDITVLETGSVGIFGLCKKKAHIRVQVRKQAEQGDTPPPQAGNGEEKGPRATQEERTPGGRQGSGRGQKRRSAKKTEPADPPSARETPAPAPAVSPPVGAAENRETAPDAAEEIPSPEHLAAIEEKLERLLSLMGLASSIQLTYADNTIVCTISGEHAAYLAGQEGRLLGNLQYLLRKMLAFQLPERVTLALDAAGYRAQRLEQLKHQVAELAEQVRRSGKSKTLAGLNPAERRTVHLALQQDTGIRSRSVGAGFFKKILIYKPGGEDRAAAGKQDDAGEPRHDD